MSDQPQEILQAARALYATVPDWITFFRKVDAIARRAYPDPTALADFKQTEEYQEIRRMLTELQERPLDNLVSEPTAVITVRLPKSLHGRLRAAAHEKQISMNRLCVSKLQVGDVEPAPAENSVQVVATGNGQPEGGVP